ncbi:MULTISPECIES: hypothetical protein [unclassified Streptomyces]|uniref:hypothetical protein n=1 Tax=unclassified Streptomyces TaxID=2593676 RepID=UPI002DDBCD79|nr:hypothetical protein [Streptomyces sp. NBC_00243]WRZ20698.1 hypothetical protein OHT59_20390 [Streptomyces sp. NBC_00243]
MRTRTLVRVLCATSAGVGLVVAGAVWPAAADAAALAPEADLSYHGDVSMAEGRVDVRLTPRNHGPSAVADATVRLRWSVALADRQSLPDGCARAEARAVVCRTGALAADGVGEEIRLGVRLRGVPAEVTVEFDTVWGGGAVDRNSGNDRQRVLVLDTGDSYVF